MGQQSWDLIASFRAVAENGSLSAAARVRDLTQPTIGRHIQQLEAALETPLFVRQPRGLLLTEAGQALLPSARDMSEAAHRFTEIAAGRRDTISGTIRITTSVILANFHMPAVIREIREKAPNIEIELRATDSAENLLFGDADIAIRMFRPEQLELVTRHVGKLSLGLYATKEYLADNGTPQTFADLKHHTFIGYDRSELILRGMEKVGYPATRNTFAIRCDDQAAYWHMVCAGCGVGIGQVSVARKEADVVQILEDVDLPYIPMWIATSRHIRNSRPLRFVVDILYDALSQIVDAPSENAPTG